MSINDLERNDVKGATALAEERIRAGTYDSDTAGILLRLQDDPTSLIEEINAVLANHQTDRSS